MKTDISKLRETEFIKLFNAALIKIKEDPIENFIKAPGFLNFLPTFSQKMILKVIFNQELDSSKKEEVFVEDSSTGEFALYKDRLTESELYKLLTKEEYKFPHAVKNKINLILGRRAGKSTLTAALAICFSIITNYKPYLKKHPYATVLILSHSRDFSEEILDLIKSFIENSPILSRLLINSKKNRQTAFNLRIPFIEEGELSYSNVMIRVGAASKKTTRGKAISVLICDEIAHWNLSENSVDSDIDIIRAVRPSLAQFKDKAYTFKLSSPSIKYGVLYNEYELSLKRELPVDYLVVKAPTWVMNNFLDSKHFEEEYKLDPVGFASEYRGDFVDSISNFTSPEHVDSCVVSGITEFEPENSDKLEISYAAAIDAAFKGDKFAFTIVGYVRGRVKQYVLEVWEGTKDDPVKVYEVVEQIRKICKRFDITKIFADQYAFQPLKEIFEKYELNLEERSFTSTFKKKIFFNLKKIIHAKQLDLLDIPFMIKEIKELQVEQSATGNIRIGHPIGGHDDSVCALAVASFVLIENLVQFNSNINEFSDKDTNYGIQVDSRTGKSIQAPSTEMLRAFWGEVQDNSNEYIKDPKTGKLRHVLDADDDEGGDDDDGPQFIW